MINEIKINKYIYIYTYIHIALSLIRTVKSNWHVTLRYEMLNPVSAKEFSTRSDERNYLQV